MSYILNKRRRLRLAARVKRNFHISKLSVPKKCQNKLAFTLAEVLISLTILGMVAALVIPSITQNIQNTMLKIAWKHTYSDLNQATTKIMTQNGGSLKGICPGGNMGCLRDKYISYLNIIKSCENADTIGKCFPASFTQLDNTAGWIGNDAGAILVNGVMLTFYYTTDMCTDNFYGILMRCGGMGVDVNGFKGPNVIGRDIFQVHILENGIKPYGFDLIYKDDCNTDPPSGVGWGCSLKYLKE